MSKPRFKLGEYIESLVEKLRKFVPAAINDGNVEAIHDARVSSRRLKAVLDLLEPVLSEDCRKPFARATRKVRKSLGPLRDLDVALEHLLAVPAMHRQAAQWLSDKLETERNEALQQAREKVAPHRLLTELGSWWGLRDQVMEAHHAVDSLLGASLHEQAEKFGELAAGLRLGDTPTEQDRPATDPHELRIVGKSLRYTLEMAKEADHELPGALLRSFKSMQEALGLWHDDVVMTERAMQLSARQMLAHHDAALQRKVLALAQLMLKRADKQLQKFACVWKERGPELQRTLDRMYPLSTAVIAPQMDPDPARLQEPPEPAVIQPGDVEAG